MYYQTDLFSIKKVNVFHIEKATQSVKRVVKSPVDVTLTDNLCYQQGAQSLKKPG